MRKIIFIFGVFILLIGFVGIVVAIIAYGQYNQIVNSYGGLGLLSPTLYNDAVSDYGLFVSGLIGGGIFFIIGVILTVLGYKSERKINPS